MSSGASGSRTPVDFREQTLKEKGFSEPIASGARTGVAARVPIFQTDERSDIAFGRPKTASSGKGMAACRRRAPRRLHDVPSGAHDVGRGSGCATAARRVRIADSRERATRRMLFDEYVSRVFEARSDIERITAGIGFTNRRVAAAREAQADLGALVERYRAALADGRSDARAYLGVYAEWMGARRDAVALEGTLAEAVVALELATGYYEVPERRPPAPPRGGKIP